MEAVLRQGVIVPLEPLPSEWKEGVVLRIFGPAEVAPKAEPEAELLEDSGRIRLGNPQQTTILVSIRNEGRVAPRVSSEEV